MSSSAQITSAACCVLVTQDTAMTVTDTGNERSPTAWVCWQCTYFSAPDTVPLSDEPMLAWMLFIRGTSSQGPL